LLDGIGAGAAAYARTPDGAQPVCCLVALEPAQASLPAFLAGGRGRVRAWLEQLGAVDIAFDDTNAFANLNTAQIAENQA
jgi:molybdopterin-guanine dinucleotide biosynthesis protein A